MSVKIMAAVWEIDGLSPAEKLLLLKHADHADDQGNNSYPSVALLVRTCGLDERRIQRTRQALIRKGFLKPIAFTTGGRGRATVYQIVAVPVAEETVTSMPPIQEKRATIEPPFDASAATEKGGISSTERVAFCREKGGAGTTPTIKEEPSKKNRPRERARSRRKPEMPIPETWRTSTTIPDELLAVATDEGLSPEAARTNFRRFVAHAETHDRRCRNWVAAFRNWVIGSKERNNGSSTHAGAGAGAGTKPRARDTFMAAAARVVSRRPPSG
jgi:hypothetical protein